ncbi:hypothetical protein BD770DRAFT_411276 [Pilaira anomala]|nr:hypothetical protein BD770DRAFT_411276 [Pilaira anomala]
MSVRQKLKKNSKHFSRLMNGILMRPIYAYYSLSEGNDSTTLLKNRKNGQRASKRSNKILTVAITTVHIINLIRIRLLYQALWLVYLISYRLISSIDHRNINNTMNDFHYI